MKERHRRGPNIGPPRLMQLSPPAPEREPRGGCFERRTGSSSSSGDSICPLASPNLPEGTDHIVDGASDAATAATATASSPRPADGDAGDRPAGEPGPRPGRRPCAARRASASAAFADDGKGRATGLLDDFSEVIDDAARSVDRAARRGLWRLCPSRRRRRLRLRRQCPRQERRRHLSTTPATSSARAPASRSASPPSPASR